LLRKTDGSKIPYDLFGISLITLLRMGIQRETKSQLYKEFLEIPLYQDMATWNLQFRGGKLSYVDRDTMDVNFDNYLPFTYKVVLALMNYKRTLDDFGKCGGNFAAKYGVNYVGDCVISDSGEISKISEKCNEDFPVPCADGECKTSFIQCMRDLEKKKINIRKSKSFNSFPGFTRGNYFGGDNIGGDLEEEKQMEEEKNNEEENSSPFDAVDSNIKKIKAQSPEKPSLFISQ
jgi:hypothetical protein